MHYASDIGNFESFLIENVKSCCDLLFVLTLGKDNSCYCLMLSSGIGRFLIRIK